MAQQNLDPPSRTEQRLWNLLLAACLALGGWWLQNQYDTILAVQSQIVESNKALIDFGKFVDEQYVEKEFYKEVTSQQYRRFDSIDKKLDKVFDRLEINHSHDGPRR